jgi:hypothetical protein
MTVLLAFKGGLVSVTLGFLQFFVFPIFSYRGRFAISSFWKKRKIDDSFVSFSGVELPLVSLTLVSSDTLILLRCLSGRDEKFMSFVTLQRWIITPVKIMKRENNLLSSIGCMK